jgi:hypothetical protein
MWANNITSDDGSSKVDSFLDQGYVRTTARLACENGMGVENVTVWVYEDARWRMFTPSDIKKLERQGSLCRSIAHNMFNLDDQQYKTLRHIFDDDTVIDLAGVYQNEKNDFALVIRFPVRILNQLGTVAKKSSLLAMAVAAPITAYIKKERYENMFAKSVQDANLVDENAWKEIEFDYEKYKNKYWPEFESHLTKKYENWNQESFNRLTSLVVFFKNHIEALISDGHQDARLNARLNARLIDISLKLNVYQIASNARHNKESDDSDGSGSEINPW